MPSQQVEAAYTQALSHFLGSIEMPRTNLTLLEWMEAKSSFYPHDGQKAVIEAIQNGKREIDVIAGYRGGKSELVRQIAFYYIAGMGKRVWVLGPTWDVVDRTFQPIWDMLVKSKVGVVERNRESRLIRVESGGLLEGVSWRTPEQIQAQCVHVAITDESQELTPHIADLIRARLVGDWLWLRIGSPAQSGMSYYEEQAQANATTSLPDHALITWPTWLNPDPEVQRTVEIEKESLEFLANTVGKDHPAYKQRRRRFDAMYGGQTLAPTDVAIPTFDPDVHVRDCPFDPDLPVYLGIDPGFYPSYYAVTVFQPHPWGTALGTEKEYASRNDELWQIDEIYLQHTITDDIIKACRQREWWPNVREAVMDVAGRQRDRQSGRSDLAIWQTSCHFPIRAEWVAVDDSLNTHRRWLSQNRLFHDKQKCPQTIREYLLHKVRARREGDAKDLEVDRWNHSHRALSYLLVLRYGVTDGTLETVDWTRQIARPDRRQWVA